MREYICRKCKTIQYTASTNIRDLYCYKCKYELKATDSALEKLLEEDRHKYRTPRLPASFLWKRRPLWLRECERASYT